MLEIVASQTTVGRPCCGSQWLRHWWPHEYKNSRKQSSMDMFSFITQYFSAVVTEFTYRYNTGSVQVLSSECRTKKDPQRRDWREDLGKGEGPIWKLLFDFSQAGYSEGLWQILYCHACMVLYVPITVGKQYKLHQKVTMPLLKTKNVVSQLFPHFIFPKAFLTLDPFFSVITQSIFQGQSCSTFNISSQGPLIASDLPCFHISPTMVLLSSLLVV